jgi:prophage regulatory protein
MKELLRDKEVAEMLSIGRSTVWLYVRDGRLPKPIKLSDRVSVWKVSDIRALIDSMTAVSA